MLPGKVYKPEDILKTLRKRIWLVVVPWAIVAAGTAAVARKLPDVYTSTALIQVVPQRVPGNIVPTMTSANLEERLRGVEQNIVNRTRLERLILDEDLYREERRSMIMQDVVEMMKNQIVRGPVRGDAFTVEFKGRDRVTVQKVAETLAGYYIQEGRNDGVSRAQDTSSFMDSAVKEHLQKLTEAEQQMMAYKLKNLGELPSERASNQAAVQSTQQSLMSLAQSIAADVNQKVSLERQIAQLESASEASSAPAAVATASPISIALDQQRQVQAAQRAQRMSAQHPDYQATQRRINELEKQLDQERLQAPVGATGAVSLGEQSRRKALQALKDELESVKRQLADKQAQEKQLRAQSATYQARVDRTPVHEAQLVNLTRNYETYKRAYDELVAGQIKTDLAVNVERRQIGEQFRLLDQARLPERPTSPNRLLINVFGILGGLAVGLGLVALLEYRDRSFKTDNELASVLHLPVLAVVPLMQSDSERRADFRKRLFLNAGFAGTVVACVAVVAYTFVFPR